MNENLNEKTGENAGENLPQTAGSYSGEARLPEGESYQTENETGGENAFSSGMHPDGEEHVLEEHSGGKNVYGREDHPYERAYGSGFPHGNGPWNRRGNEEERTRFSDSVSPKDTEPAGIPEDEIPYFKKLYETLKNEGERSTNAAREELLCSARHGRDCGGYHHCGGADCICHEVFPWAGFVGLTFASGWISSLFLQPSTFRWFATLEQPAMMPPQWIFLPVWILLYFLLGTSVWISWRKAGCRRALPVLVLYGILMLLQIAWCYTFFYGHNPFGGFINLIWIFGVSLLLMLASLPICRCAAILLIPQVLWIFYALIINYQVWHLNVGGIVD